MKAKFQIIVAAFLSFFFFCTTAAARDDVLVIVNDNSIDSPQVGTYYAQQRGIPSSNIVHVRVPNQYYIDWPQFLSLRDQILRNGICPSVASTIRPSACADATQTIYTQSNIDTLTAATKIRYIVTTRGVPTRMTVDGSTLFDGTSSTSIDNYLRFWLARFIQSDIALAFIERSYAFGDGRGMRIVNPAADKEYIIGRIDGVDLSSAQALVDRAIKVEANGLYGKSYGSTFGNTLGLFQWTNYTTGQSLYQPSDNSNNYWRYAFGLFGENRPECSNYSSNYLAYPQGDASGKSPTYCLAQFNLGTPNDAAPGVSYSRQPIAVDAFSYFGSLDGQGIEGGFPTALNWRKNNNCTVTLCENAPNPLACRAASTDPFKEINTDCVGVADGFIGYNFQSFPVSILGIWPTGWVPQDVDRNDVPVIRSNDGQDGANSAWFSQLDDASNSSCYSYDTVQNLLGSSTLCPARQWVGLRQDIAVPNPSTPTTYRFSFSIKGNALAASSTVYSRLQSYYYPDTNSSTQQSCPTTDSRYTLNWDGACIYTDIASHPITTSWTGYSRDVVIPVLTGWKNTQLHVVFGQNQLPQGAGLGFDSISLVNITDPTNPELVVNGSFDQGHKQDSMGDYAAEFLSRLGGTAFWGSLSHHESQGHSFDQTSLGTLVYFMRGLPLGDAVWLGEKHNSGVFYGDPLYSPISVRFDYLQTPSDSIIGTTSSVALSGDAFNGTDPIVSTTYSISYCQGTDFYLCDQQNTWQSTGLSGAGGKRNQPFGTWNLSGLTNGSYVLRLGVTSTNATLGKTQSFFDYYPITKRDPILTGVITDTSGQPLVGVTVTVQNSVYNNSVLTDINGIYSISLPAGSYVVSPTKVGHSFQPIKGNLFQLLTNQDVTKSFTATALNYYVSGFIKDQKGLPISGAVVTILRSDGITFTTTSNVNGYYVQGGLTNAGYLLTVSYPTNTFHTKYMTIANASVTGMNFVGQGWSVSGTVKNPVGQGIGGLAIDFYINGSNTPTQVITNANGIYSLTKLSYGDLLVISPDSGCFSPDTIVISSVNQNVTGQDFSEAACP